MNTTPAGGGGAPPPDPLASTPSPPQSWVQFDGEDRPRAGSDDSPGSPPPGVLPPPPSRAATLAAAASVSASSGPAVIDSVQVTLSAPTPASRTVSSPPASNGTASRQPISHPLTSSVPHGAPSGLTSAPLQTVPLDERPPQPANNSGIRQGFANGDVIVTLLPQNTSMAWITPANFRPELVPEELMAQGLTLTVEDYVHIMTQLVNDDRFKLFNICYKRIVIAWILLGFVILLCILFFSGGKQLELFGAGIAWLLLNAGAIFLCMWIKIRLNRGLEKCMASINMQLMKHKILLGLDDRGKLSCHKVNLCFIYFDTTDCLVKLNQLIEEDARATAAAAPAGTDGAAAARSSLQTRLDLDDPDIIISGATTRRISREQERSRFLLARYSQRWVKAVCRGRLQLAIDPTYAARNNTAGLSLSPPPPRLMGLPPRHASTLQCPCQFVEEHINYKPQGCFGVCDVWRYSNGMVPLGSHQSYASATISNSNPEHTSGSSLTSPTRGVIVLP